MKAVNYFPQKAPCLRYLKGFPKCLCFWVSLLWCKFSCFCSVKYFNEESGDHSLVLFLCRENNERANCPCYVVFLLKFRPSVLMLDWLIRFHRKAFKWCQVSRIVKNIKQAYNLNNLYLVLFYMICFNLLVKLSCYNKCFLKQFHWMQIGLVCSVYSNSRFTDIMLCFSICLTKPNVYLKTHTRS